MAERVASVVNRVINSNTFINVCLVGCFSVLGLRSLNQQSLIEALEYENSRTSSTNKSLHNIIWDSKQKLYAESASASDSPVVPLSRLQSIYGDILPSSTFTRWSCIEARTTTSQDCDLNLLLHYEFSRLHSSTSAL